MTTLASADAKTLRAAIYVRISDDEDGKGDGVARQKADCLKRAKNEGWHVVKVFTENDVGASRHSKKRRPEYAEMVRMATRGEIDVILAYSNSRLTRRMLDFEQLVQLVEKHNIKIRTIVSGDDDLSQADGLMVARIKASVDAAEADRISERVRRAVADKVGRGEWLGGPRPFGWGWTEWVDGKRVDHGLDDLNEAEAKMIRDGAKHLLDGGSVGALIRAWNESGLTTARGANWRHVTVNRVLTRWRNAGVYEYGEKPLPDVAVSWTPILTAQEVEQLRGILSDPKRGKAKGYEPKHLMSGIAVCGKPNCGHVLKSGAVLTRCRKGETEKAKYLIYRCSGPGCGLAITRDNLDDAVSRKMMQRYVTDSPGRFRAAQDETSNLLAATNRALAKVLAERAEWIAMINDKLMSPAEIKPKLADLTERETQLREDIARAHREDAHAAMTAAALSVFEHDGESHKLGLDYQDKMLAKWNDMELEARRRLIRALVTVTVMPGRAAKRIVIDPKDAAKSA